MPPIASYAQLASYVLWCAIAFGVLAYFLPTWIAMLRGSRWTVPIVTLNALAAVPTFWAVGVVLSLLPPPAVFTWPGATLLWLAMPSVPAFGWLGAFVWAAMPKDALVPQELPTLESAN